MGGDERLMRVKKKIYKIIVDAALVYVLKIVVLTIDRRLSWRWLS